LHQAFARARAQAELTSADLVVYHRGSRYVGSPYARSRQGGGTQINLAQLNIQNALPIGKPAGFYYLWAPRLQQP
jgi:hypothetical protein